MERIVTIPTGRTGELEKAVRSLARTAHKLGLQPLPSMREVPGSRRELPQDRTDVTIIEGSVENIENKRLVVPVVDCVLTLPDEGVRVAGEWSVLAVLQATASEKGENEIYCRPADLSKVDQFRSSELECEHCKAQRVRTKTLVVESVSGRQLQVGKECAQLYVGDRVDHEVRGIEFHEYVTKLLRPLEEGRDLHAAQALTAWDAEDVVAHASACVRTMGWAPAKIPGDPYGRPNPESTANYVQAMLGVRGGDIEIDPSHPPYVVTDGDREGAKRVIEWLEGIRPDPEKDAYAASLQAVFEPGWISEKRLRFAVSAIRAHERALAEIEAKRQAAISQHVGRPEERRNFTLKIEACHSFDTNFGTKYVYRFRDAAGNAFSWFTMGFGIEESQIGGTFHLTATVKEHGEYRGVKTTGLSRLKIIREALPGEETPILGIKKKKSKPAAVELIEDAEVEENKI